MTTDPTDGNLEGIFPAGHVIDHPDAHLLVGMGVAIPADEECARRAGMTEAQMAAAQHAARRLAAGIHPDDFAKFDAGEIAGYEPDGSYKPGPNAVHVPDDDE